MLCILVRNCTSRSIAVLQYLATLNIEVICTKIRRTRSEAVQDFYICGAEIQLVNKRHNCRICQITIHVHTIQINTLMITYIRRGILMYVYTMSSQ